MLRLESEVEKVVGVLHDFLEDTRYTPKQLRKRGYSDEVLGALDCLTRREGETYEAFVQRIKPNPLARRVKLADLADNMDVTRLTTLGKEDLDRLNRYHKAWAALQ